MAKGYNIRMSLEGGKEFIAELTEAAKTSEGAARALKLLTNSNEQFASIADGVNKKMAETGKALREATPAAAGMSYEMRQLSIQASQAISGIATGQPVMMVLMQQGHQVADSMLAGGKGFSGLGSAAKTAFSAIGGWPTVAIAGLAAGIAVVVSRASDLTAQSRELSTTIGAIGRSSELSTGQLQQFALSLAKKGVDTKDATAIVGGLARTPGLSQAQIGQITQMSPDLGVALGVEAKDAAKLLGEAASGSFEAIRRIDDGLNLLSAGQRSSVQSMLEHGNRIGALGIVFDQLGRRIDGVREGSLSRWDRAMEEIGNGYKSVVTGFASPLADGVIEDADPQADKIPRARKNIRAGTFSAATRNLAVALNSAPTKPPNAVVDGVVAHDVTALTDAGKREAEAQFKRLDELTDAYRRQDQVLAASLPNRARVRAEQQADLEIVKQKLTGDTAAEYKSRAVAAAIKEASDAASQDAQAIGRQTAAALALAGATEQGRSAMLVATAAAEAHEKAATQAGVSEAALTERIVNRTAAQESTKGAAALLDLQDQIAASKALAAATDVAGQHTATLNNTIAEMTRGLRANAAATTDPGIRAGLLAQVEATERLATARDRAGAAERTGGALIDARQQTATQAAIAAAYDGTQASIDRATNAQRALSLVMTQFGETTSPEAANAVEALRTEYDNLTTAQNRFAQTRASVDALATGFEQSFSTIGSSITSAMTQGGQSVVTFGSIARGVLSELTQQIIKMAVINPALNALMGGNRPTADGAMTGLMAGAGGLLTRLFGGGNAGGWVQDPFISQEIGGGGFLDLTSSFFATGGVMTSRGPLPLRKYAGGGVANSPQVAIFGEGATNEAFVPLPNGNAIPVQFTSGSQSRGQPTVVINQGNVTVHVADSNASPAVIAAAVDRAVQRSHAELIAEVSRGGALAKAFGRRGR